MLKPDFENLRCGKALCRIAKGDCSALEVIYETLGRRMFFLALSFLHNESDAEDVTSEALLEVVSSAGRFTPGSGARAWVLSIVKNLSLKKLRERRRIDDLYELGDGQGLDEDELFSKCETLDLVRRTLAPEEQRIVLLHYYGGYKLREIAEMLGVSTEVVKKRSQRALKKLAEQYPGKR